MVSAARRSASTSVILPLRLEVRELDEEQRRDERGPLLGRRARREPDDEVRSVRQAHAVASRPDVRGEADDGAFRGIVHVHVVRLVEARRGAEVGALARSALGRAEVILKRRVGLAEVERLGGELARAAPEESDLPSTSPRAGPASSSVSSCGLIMQHGHEKHRNGRWM